SIATQTTLQLLTRSGAVAGTLLRLPDTAEEARTIAGLLQVNDRQIYLRERAQEQTVYDLSDQGQLQGLRYLLFSTHGLLSGQFLPPEVPEAPAHRVGPTPAVPPAEPREPALALTLVGDLRGHDGFLKMGEILGLKLDTDLVVLSACNTVGEVAQKENRGEGFVGLTRAFLFAGAHRLLVSHWSVDSAASRDLMTATFTRLQAGQLPADALAEARQAVRRKTVQSPGSSVTVAYAHPLFWAPFVVVGD
ncbi:MAG: CHAT domain-containing protein, partial [Candidatus Contendobacter sp.]|nr:CHAT domain-containing protein [Candidatus Contendobacter sp.]